MPRIPKVIATRGRAALGRAVVDALHAVPKLTRNMPHARRRREGLTIWEDVDYVGTGLPAHRLDVFRLSDAPPEQRALIYVHGGGFSACSKDTHIGLAVAFARRGFTVFNINYRLAPRHPYPAAIEDCADAYAWVIDNAATFGGDVSRLALAGESAGANLVTAMTIAATYERTEAYAQKIFATRVVPRATLPACGLLQVTDVERLARRRHLPAFIVDRLVEVTENYLPVEVAGSSLDMADPVCVLERREPPARSLPPFFIPCGTKDPILDDTRRLGRAVAALGARADVKIYPGEMHAFHALMWRAHAKQCWADTHAFLKDVLK